ncbi:hypothetical protein Acid345_0588 [Candidatus Koribacter versatilis Ellin345]|uniref:Uncharacterized protein n=1 Tax=Koribacter versatilis (strain Ellin345) TaxID=204669 RepID=Q1IU57_KORVE|nr:hypothetical protein [Candidatus Koribacter versatilis]ABF39593.1 hypothetical protein Acid345_0588 [Candidatus Koribacter versatilis Ellin345]
MIETRDRFDGWLDTALAEYSNVEPTLGFESRMLAAVRGRKQRAVWMWSTGLAAAAVVVISFLTALNQPVPSAPPVVSARISVPAIERVTAQAAAEPKQRKTRPQDVQTSIRGVPVVASPFTPQEEAVLRLVRNSRAKQLAGLVAQPRDLSKEVDLLQFKEMEIPVLGREEEQ